jgi:hypothetical protein
MRVSYVVDSLVAIYQDLKVNDEVPQLHANALTCTSKGAGVKLGSNNVKNSLYNYTIRPRHKRTFSRSQLPPALHHSLQPVLWLVMTAASDPHPQEPPNYSPGSISRGSRAVSQSKETRLAEHPVRSP